MISHVRFKFMRALPTATALFVGCLPVPLWAQCASPPGVANAENSASIAASGSPTASVGEPEPLWAGRETLDRPPRPVAPSSDVAWAGAQLPGAAAGLERRRSARWDWGSSALNLSGYRIKSAPTELRSASLIPDHDRSITWGGVMAYEADLGPRDRLSFDLGGAIGKQRSAFAPQIAHSFSSRSLTASLVWQHDRRFAIAASLRSNHVSAAASPSIRLSARAAGSPLEGDGVHLVASLFPLARQTAHDGPRSVALMLDIYHQRLSERDAALFRANGNRQDSGALLTVKVKF